MSNYYPYRKYSRYPLERRPYRWRMNHDAWCWLMIAIVLGVFVALELWR